MSSFSNLEKAIAEETEKRNRFLFCCQANAGDDFMYMARQVAKHLDCFLTVDRFAQDTIRLPISDNNRVSRNEQFVIRHFFQIRFCLLRAI